MKFGKTLPVIIASAMGLVGCTEEGYEQIRVNGQYHGVKVQTWSQKGMERGLVLYDENASSYKENRLYAKDMDNDGRFDVIDLKAVERGHRFESLANLDSLEAAYAEVMGQAQ